MEISRAAIDCGIRKIRLTGGEPLVRQGIVDLCRQLRALPGLETLAMTTNGALLPALAQPLRDAGLDRLTSASTPCSQKNLPRSPGWERCGIFTAGCRQPRRRASPAPN